MRSSAWVLQLVLFSMIASRRAEEFPEPRIVAVGATGVGKSSLANALLGCDPRGHECMFGVCSGMNSCTNQTAIGTGPWLGDEVDFTVVDTPGFGDSSGSDNKLIEEMMDVLDGQLGYANTILLVLEGNTPRFSSGLYDMLRQMTSIFGDSWWQFMMIGVSKWPYDQAAIDKRQKDCDFYGDPSEECKNEAWFKREFNSQLQEKFHITKNFTFAFMDSYSQSGPELGDEVQQQHWQEETQLLWDHATLNDETFEFLTIDEVLEENQLCKEENGRLHDIIDENITLLFNYVQANSDKINTTQTDLSILEIKVDSTQAQVDINVVDIDALEIKDDLTQAQVDKIVGVIDALEIKVAQVDSIQAQVDINVFDIDALEVAAGHTRTDLNTVTGLVNTNIKDIDALELVVGKLPEVPIGTILAWVTKPVNDIDAFADLPDGWVKCDGSTIPHNTDGPSIWAGRKVPDLNLGERFLRGGVESQMLTLEDDQFESHYHSHSHSITDPGHQHHYIDHYAANSADGSNFYGWTHGSDNLKVSHTELTLKVDAAGHGRTNITIKTASAGATSGNHGTETRPKNMRVLYIMRVW